MSPTCLSYLGYRKTSGEDNKGSNMIEWSGHQFWSQAGLGPSLIICMARDKLFYFFEAQFFSTVKFKNTYCYYLFKMV